MSLQESEVSSFNCSLLNLLWITPVGICPLVRIKALILWSIIFPFSLWTKFLLWMLYFVVILEKKKSFRLFSPSDIIFDVNIHTLHCMKNEIENANHVWRLVCLQQDVLPQWLLPGASHALWQRTLSPLFKISSMRKYLFNIWSHQILIALPLKLTVTYSVLFICFILCPVSLLFLVSGLKSTGNNSSKLLLFELPFFKPLLLVFRF